MARWQKPCGPGKTHSLQCGPGKTHVCCNLLQPCMVCYYYSQLASLQLQCSTFPPHWSCVCHLSQAMPISRHLPRAEFGRHLKINVFRPQNLDLCRRIRRKKYNPDFSRRNPGRVRILPAEPEFCPFLPAESDKHWPKPIWQGKVWAPIAKDSGSDSETQAERQASDC